jgi:hypothetical protein
MAGIPPKTVKIGPPRKAGLPHPTNSIAVFLQIRLSFSHRPISQFTQALPGERKSVREAEIGAAFSARPKEGPKARFPKKSPFGPGPSGDKARKHRFGVKNGDYVKNSRNRFFQKIPIDLKYLMKTKLNSKGLMFILFYLFVPRLIFILQSGYFQTESDDRCIALD